MAEDDQHRRVEARTAIPGSGMLTEPERIRALEGEAERRKRAWRAPPAEGFSSVLSRTPAKEHERIGTYVPSDERLSEGGERDAEGDEASGESETELPDGHAARPAPVELDAGALDASDGAPPSKKAGEKKGAAEPRATGRPRPNEVGDPRMRALHQLLDGGAKKRTK